jgi:Transposase DDE domain
MIFPTSLPKIKAFLRPAHLSAATVGLLVRLITAFCQHPGRMSADAAAHAVRSQGRHRAQIARFLARSHWSKNWRLLQDVALLLLQREARSDGPWLFLLDQTYCGQQGQKTENTFHCGNRTRRPHKGRRYQKRRVAKRSGHAFVMGLLLTPSGLRLPCCRCYYTRDYCQARGRTYQKQPQLAAELIDQLVVPAGARVVVLGDTAFEAQVIRAACAGRGFTWIVPLNPERVLAGAPKSRPKVRSLAGGWTADDYQAVRLVPGQGAYAAQQRASRCRVGPHSKARTFWVHPERRAVHNVGDVLLVFSTKEPPKPGQAVAVQKILMTNGVGLSAADVVSLYSLRWQIELYFKELKSTLGLAQYRFRRFAKVEGWVQACLVAFCYLEWYRAQQLERGDLSAKEKAWWRWQRSHGIARRVRQQAEEADLVQLWRGSGSRGGLRKLRRLLRQALPPECTNQR